MTGKQLLIINADDFGYNSKVNAAIISSFEGGLCSSSTIMPNMPGFEEACELIHENRLLDSIGLHLVLSEGAPITNQLKRYPRICREDGRFHINVERQKLFRLSTYEKEALRNEIVAQIECCRRNHIPLTHIDSHHHVHIEWGVTNLLVGIIKDMGIRFIRPGRVLDPNSTWIKKLYRRCLNIRLKLAGAIATQCFGTVEDYVRLHTKDASSPLLNSFEIMIHPGFNERDILVDLISNRPLQQYIGLVDNYRAAIPFGKI